MSYTPTTWAAGDTVTATKLNNMETGIANAANPFVVMLTPTALDYSGTMDKTTAEITSAFNAGQRIVFALNTGDKVVNFYASEWYETSGDIILSAATIYVDNNVIIRAHNDAGPTSTTYSTHIYTLTPAS